MGRSCRTSLLLLCIFVPLTLAGTTAASVRSIKGEHHRAGHHRRRHHKSREHKARGRKPFHTKSPRITGRPEVGHDLHAWKGRWKRAFGFTFDWKLCNSHGARCKLIGKRKRPKDKPATYRITRRDVGHTIRVTVLARNAAGRASATSRATAVVRRGSQSAKSPAPGTGAAPSGGSGSSGVPIAPPGSLGSGQSVAFWLAWSGSVQESQIPWAAVTQVDLFALSSTTNTSGCSTNCTMLDTSKNGISRMNVPGWVSMIHQQGRLAIISIGGSTDQDWANACSSNNVAGFANELVKYMVSNGFDGVDIDIESLNSNSQSTWNACVQSIAQAAHAVKTQAGNTPIVSTDVDQSWMDWDVAGFYQWPDQFNLMYYGYPTGSYSCANGCSKVDALVQGLHNTGHVPYNKMVLGMSPGGGQAQCCYQNLATTAATVDTGGSVTSIALSSGLSAALPAGNVVLASTENPPAHYEIFTTSGAAAGATSIPITGTVSGSGAYAFPSGSDVQSDYAGPWDCGNFARYATTHGLAGVMIWDLQEEASQHNGQFPCFTQVAPYVAPSP